MENMIIRTVGIISRFTEIKEHRTLNEFENQFYESCCRFVTLYYNFQREGLENINNLNDS